MKRLLFAMVAVIVVGSAMANEAQACRLGWGRGCRVTCAPAWRPVAFRRCWTPCVSYSVCYTPHYSCGYSTCGYGYSNWGHNCGYRGYGYAYSYPVAYHGYGYAGCTGYSYGGYSYSPPVYGYPVSYSTAYNYGGFGWGHGF